MKRWAVRATDGAEPVKNEGEDKLVKNDKGRLEDDRHFPCAGPMIAGIAAVNADLVDELGG